MAARTRTATKKAPARTKRAAPPVEEELDDELEEEEEAAPKKKKVAAKPAKEVLGSAWLKEHVNDTLGSDHESTKLRIVLRKLIKNGEIDSPKDGRYVFTGPRDPNVKAVIAALREEAKSGPAKRGRKPKAAKAAEEAEEEYDEEVEDLDLDD